MTNDKLTAFHGQKQEKEICLNQTYEWLRKQMMPKTPEEITQSIFNPIRTFEPPDFVLLNYDSYPEKLGLPMWLSNLLRTINQNNSRDFILSGTHYEVSFYPKFITSCKEGVDYSLMFHQWELFLFTEFIPEQESSKQYILDTIELHKKALTGYIPPKKKWEKYKDELFTEVSGWDEFLGVPSEVGLKVIDAFEKYQQARKNSEGNSGKLLEKAHHLERFMGSYTGIIRNSARAAYLSIADYVNPNKTWVSSSEAIVNAAWSQFINKGGYADNKEETKFKQMLWEQLINKLISMMEKWQ